MSMGYYLEDNVWESDFFQKKIGRLVFSDKTKTGSKSFADFELVQCKVNANDIAHLDLLYELGFEKIEGEVDYRWSFSSDGNLIDGSSITTATDKNIIGLRKLVVGAFYASRFRLPYFTLQQNDAFYQCWIERAVKGEFDDVCLIDVDNDVITGAVTIRRLDDISARIGLLVAGEAFRGRGIASRLLIQAQMWCKQRKIEQLNIATQKNNANANILYQKIGANMVSQSIWFYKVGDR